MTSQEHVNFLGSVCERCRCDSCCEDIDVFTWSHSAVLSSSWRQTRKSLHVKVTGRLGLVELKLMLDRISRKKTWLCVCVWSKYLWFFNKLTLKQQESSLSNQHVSLNVILGPPLALRGPAPHCYVTANRSKDYASWTSLSPCFYRLAVSTLQHYFYFLSITLLWLIIYRSLVLIWVCSVKQSQGLHGPV